MPGNSCELGAQGEAVAVETVGAGGVGEMREQGRPLGAEGAVEGEQAGGAPRRPVRTRVPRVGRFLPVQRREEREVCQWRQRGKSSQSVYPQGGEGSAGHRGNGGGGGRLGKERESEGV